MIATRRDSDLHPVTAYAVDVVDGRIVTGRPVQWAAQRHLEDLEQGEKRAGLWFDEAAADRIVRFFGQLTFVEGERAGEPFILEPWQEFCLGSVFGWMRADGFRRFRESWVRVASGNGKSPMGGGVGLYCTGWDGHYGDGGTWKPEQRAQVFTCATKLKQARIIHGVSMLQREKSAYLRARLTPRRDRLVHLETSSFYEPMGRDSKTEDGWNPLCAIFDEVHAYANRGMWDVLAAKMVKRRQPLIFAVTTAGYGGPGTFGLQQDEYYRAIIDPNSGLRNDSAFVYIAELDPKTRCAPCRGTGAEGRCRHCEGKGFTGDDYTDEAAWIKPNPNLSVSVYIEGLRDRVVQAQRNKRLEPDVLVKNMNQWQQSGTRGMSLDAWDACGVACPMPPETELRRRPCFAGLDLASNRDLNALELFFPICGPWKVAALQTYVWVPEETVPERRKGSPGIDYEPWIEAGEIISVPGQFMDHEVIRAKMNALAKSYAIRKVGADRRFGDTLLPALEKDGFEVVRIAQSFANICPAWQKLEQLVGNQRLAHGGHYVMRWFAGNVVLARDPDGLEMPSKTKSQEKIDGIAALLNAIHLAMTTPFAGVSKAPESHALPARRGGGKRAILTAFR